MPTQRWPTLVPWFAGAAVTATIVLLIWDEVNVWTVIGAVAAGLSALMAGLVSRVERLEIGPVQVAMEKVAEAAKEVAATTPTVGPTTEEAPPPTDTGVPPTTPSSVDRLVAALAELTVAQNRPHRDPLVKTYFFPILLALIAILVPAASLVRDVVDDDDVDCSAYITSVLSIGGQDATSATLDALVDKLDFRDEAADCGVTPREILEGAGKLS